jgi:hypothetical protein
MSRVRVVAGVLAAVIVVEGAMLATDTGPNIVLVGAIVAMTVAIVAAVVATDRIAVRAEATRRPSTDDGRTELHTVALRLGLAESGHNAYLSDRLHRQLVALIDDELLASHGVDRRADPQAAGSIMGQDLTDFVERSDAGPPMSLPVIVRMVTLIEQI